MLITLHALQTLLTQLLGLINGWLAGHTVQSVPTAAHRNRLHLRNQLVVALHLLQVALTADPHELPALRSPFLWLDIEKTLAAARRQDPTFEAVEIYIGPEACSSGAKVPLRIELTATLDDLGYGTE